ncbi:hypothetical protein ACLKA7_004203 [Drosophila subpalustris]
MEQRANFLALTLLDALEDENESDIFAMLERNIINSSVVPCERGLAPLHYVCGMQNEELALRILQRFLASDQVDVNVCCDGNMTPLHIAAMYGRVELVRLLLEHGARPDLLDDEHKMPMHYAIDECHFEVLQLFSDHILKEKQEKQLKHSLKTPKSGIKYNHDVTSPYYINITHRRNRPQPTFPDDMEEEHSVNLFALTRDHLAELAKNNREEPSGGRRTLIESWRDKVERSRVRKSLLQEELVEALVDQAMTQDDFNYEQHVQQTLRESEQEREQTAASQPQTASEAGRAAFGELVEQVAQACVLEQSYHTALQDEIATPRREDYYLQMTEAYVHTDDENGLVFYETKLLQNPGKKVPTKRREEHQLTVPTAPQLDSSVSTNLTIPLDYETDALRAELTQLGAPVGPITRTTKRLYIKQLIKYKRNTEALLAAQKHAKAAQIKYSVELHHSLRSRADLDRIEREYMTYEINSATHFATAAANGRELREGHLKQSFIYMLIDPRISRNLPGERNFLDPLCIWSRFLDAIFYVGKGKCSRPYAHLYDAMRQHTRAHLQQHQQQQTPVEKRGKVKRRLLMPELFKSPPPAASGQPASGSRKLQRILDIWQHGSGVVCLHVFHNILPTDAYTREASIIDALGLTHLTNLKRGDYYGPAQIWTMKQKKQLGIALLHKAMNIYLAEGESQLSLSVLSSTGLRLYSIAGQDKVEEIFAKDNTEQIRIVERLFNSSLVVLVTSQKPNCLKMLHFKKKQDICNCFYPSEILCVRMNRQRLIVCLAESIHIHDIRDMKILHSIENIAPNELGLCALSLNSHLAFPICQSSGELRIFNANKLRTGMTIKAHDTPLSALTFSPSGALLATASERGTVIRVFCVKNGQRVQEFRRGVKRCVRIASLVFAAGGDFLCASSNTETVHVFKIDAKAVETAELKAIAEVAAKSDSLSKEASTTTVTATATATTKATAEDATEGAAPATPAAASWGGMFTKAVSSLLLPAQVSDVLAQDRAFATVALPQSGLKNICALTRVQKELRLLIACEDGFLYMHDFNVERGGACKLLAVHDLRGALEDVIELQLSESVLRAQSKPLPATTMPQQSLTMLKSCAASVLIENPDPAPDNSYAGILRGEQTDAMSDSAKFRKLCDAIDTPTKLYDERQFPPVAIAAKD